METSRLQGAVSGGVAGGAFGELTCQLRGALGPSQRQHFEWVWCDERV